MKSSDLKLLIVLPNLACGGSERTAAELANFIVEQGGEVTIVLMFKEEIFYEIHPKVKIIEPDYPKKKIANFLNFFSIIYFLRYQFKRQQPDVILALGYIALTLFSSIGIRTKLIMSYRSNPARTRFPDNSFLNTIYDLSYFLMKFRVDGIIAQTELAAKVYRQKYRCPIVTIPNFLRELKEYNTERQNIIINVGHLTADKAQHYLIKAFALINAPNWKLMIVGEGPRRKELEGLSIRLNVNDRVIFTGYQKDIDLYLSKSKIFAFTSIIEGYPNALIEAMATPLPCISFDCNAGPSEIIKDAENGFLVEVGDIHTFASRIQELIDNPGLREQIQQKAMNIRCENNLSKIAPRYLQCLRVIGTGNF
jgi:GalNAc-alpha-(1->4)-GalNAc-alpha-(1->3)-diNAcBac-PP-undecaprenol alpha-1,4-N-acetyl-D-galactosaminyltransferase